MILTPDLAARMLDVYRRRLRDTRKTTYAQTLLDAALESLALPRNHMRGKPPFLGHGSYLARPKWRHPRGADRRG